jgi:hypothetical protein
MRVLHSNYRRKHEQSVEHRKTAQQHEENITAVLSATTSIDRVVTEQHASRHEQDSRENARRIREWLTIVALVITAFVGGYGIWRTHRDTVTAITEAHTSANQQHQDTLSALSKTDANIAALNGQASIMNDQSRVSRDEFTATNRPWISIDSMKISSPLVFGDNGNITVSVQFSLTNSGHTPAIFVNPNVIPVLMTAGHQLSKVISSTRAYCENRRVGEFSPMESGILVRQGKLSLIPFTLAVQ